MTRNGQFHPVEILLQSADIVPGRITATRHYLGTITALISEVIASGRRYIKADFGSARDGLARFIGQCERWIDWIVGITQFKTTEFILQDELAAGSGLGSLRWP